MIKENISTIGFCVRMEVSILPVVKLDWARGHIHVACHGLAVKSTRFKLWCLISRVWVRVPVLTLVSLSKTLNHDCFINIGEVVLSALPARLLMDDTQA